MGTVCCSVALPSCSARPDDWLGHCLAFWRSRHADAWLHRRLALYSAEEGRSSVHGTRSADRGDVPVVWSWHAGCEPFRSVLLDFHDSRCAACSRCVSGKAAEPMNLFRVLAVTLLMSLP